MIVLLDGVNGSGKSTVCSRLPTSIRGIPVRLVKRDARANAILSVLGDTSIPVMYRMYAACAFHAYMQALRDDKSINVYDRSIISTFAMQVRMEGGGLSHIIQYADIVPSDCVSILLTVHPDDIPSRLSSRSEVRDGKACFDGMTTSEYAQLQEHFLEAQSEFATLTKMAHYVIEPQSIDDVVNRVCEIIGDSINALYRF